MNAPSLLETCLHILLEKQMSEYQLVLVDSFLGDHQRQGPLDFVLEGEALVDFHDP